MNGPDTKPLTVFLPAEQVAQMDEAVRAGAYASDSEIVRDALRLWEQREHLRKREIARLKRAYDEGMASGEGRPVDADTFLAELKQQSAAGG